MRYILLTALLLGCMDAAAMERHQECLQICNVTANSCNDFNEEDCTSYCSELVSMEEVEDFRICAYCYIAVYCDNNSYAYVCYPVCEGGL